MIIQVGTLVKCKRRWADYIAARRAAGLQATR